MGRGLLPLQNSIPEIAKPRHPDPVCYAQLLAEITDWEPAKPPDSQSGQYKGGQNFDRRRLGLREYGIVRASLSRALRRLETLLDPRSLTIVGVASVRDDADHWQHVPTS